MMDDILSSVAMALSFIAFLATVVIGLALLAGAIGAVHWLVS